MDMANSICNSHINRRTETKETKSTIVNSYLKFLLFLICANITKLLSPSHSSFCLSSFAVHVMIAVGGDETTMAAAAGAAAGAAAAAATVVVVVEAVDVVVVIVAAVGAASVRSAQRP